MKPRLPSRVRRGVRAAAAAMVAMAAAVLAAGCASTSAPRLPASSTTHESACASGAGTAPAWWLALGDPQLDALVEQGMAANEDLAQAAGRLEQARALADEAQAVRLPRVDAALGLARERVPRLDDRAEDGSRLPVPPYRQSRLSARLEASYEVDLMGRLRASTQAALAQQSAGACDLVAVRRWVARELVLAYADLQLAEAQLQANARDQRLAADLQAALAARLRAGTIARAPWQQAARAALELREEAATLGLERERSRSRLAVLAGLHPAQLPQWLADTQPHAAGASLERAEALAAALPATLGLAQADARPDVHAAWLRTVAAAAQSRQAGLERYPSLTLSGNAGQLADTLKRWLRGDALAWAAEAALSMPLLDGGRADARERAAAAVLAQEQAAYRKTVLQAAADLGTALAELDAGMARTDLARREHQLAELAHASVRAELRAGLVPRSAALQAQRDLVDAERSLQRQRHALLAAWVGSQQALGR